MIKKKAKNKIIKSRGITTGTWPAHYCTLEVGGSQIKGEKKEQSQGSNHGLARGRLAP